MQICQGRKSPGSGSGRSKQFFPRCGKNRSGWVAVDPANTGYRICVHLEGTCENGPYRFPKFFDNLHWDENESAQSKFHLAVQRTAFVSLEEERLRTRTLLQGDSHGPPSSPSRENNWLGSAGESSDEDLESTASNIPVDKNPKTTAAQTTTVPSSSSLSSEGGSEDDSVPQFSPHQAALLDFINTPREILSKGEKRKLHSTIQETDEKRAKVCQSRNTKRHEIQKLQRDKDEIEAQILLKETQIEQDSVKIGEFQSETDRIKKRLAKGDEFVNGWMKLVKANPSLQALQSPTAFAEDYVHDHTLFNYM